MANKPALRCENCMVNVHENSCRDQISDCIRFRGPLKMSARPASLQSAMPSQLQVPRDRPVPLPTNLKPPLISGFTTSSPPGKENRKQNGGTPPKQTPTSSYSPNIPSLSSPSKVINEERDSDTVDDSTSKFGSIVDINSASMESLDDGASEIALIDDEPELRLTEEEPEGWSSTVDKKLLKKLKDRDIKRQENIYEFIITEKHHCQTLKLMQKVFAQGMLKELHYSQDLVDRLFPCLDTLIELHSAFLKRLRERQKIEPVISSIGDVLQIQFQGKIAQQMMEAYGEFCSHHKEAVSLYKDILKSDRRFQSFIKNCSLRPLCKNKGIPECILLVTQRITKYPLLIESLIKASKDYKSEQQNLIHVNAMVKEILSNVNAQVAEKEREQRLLEIYHKIDAKSATIYKSKKFKKSDLLSNNRKLRYEGSGCLRHARGKEIEVTVVVLSDVIFFLQDNNQKYSFVTQDSKAGVISLQKLLVREKAGQDNRGIYLISSHPSAPEMYELICHSTKEKLSWMEAIQSAVEMCPEDDEGFSGEVEEERKLSDYKSARLRELTESLHEKDRELAVICEEKMRLLGEMMEVVDKDEVMEPVHYLSLFEENRERPDTRDMLLAAVQEASRLASSLYVTGTNLSRSVSSAGEHQSEAYVSPILPKRAETFGGFDNPNKDLFPKLVLIRKKGTTKEEVWPQTISGMLNKNEHHTSSGSDLDQKDNEALLSVKNKETRRASGPLPTRETLSPGSPEKPSMRRSTLTAGFLPLQLTCADNLGSSGSVDESSSSKELLSIPTPQGSLGREQWATTIQLLHYLNTLMCVFSQHLTSVETLKAELAKAYEENAKLHKEGGRDIRDKKSLYRPNQQLEELRNLQGQLTRERTEWQKEKESQEKEIEEKRQELLRLQDGLRNDKEDVNQQRDLLYRQLEALQKKGIMLSPSLTVVATSSAGTPATTTTVQSSSDIMDKHTLSPPSSVGDSSGLVSPSVHRRSWSCDMQLPNRDHVTRTVDTSVGSSISATPSPTQTVEAIKPKPELKPRSSASNLTSLMKKDLFQNVLPINLYSATNQQKSNQGLQVKQQLPMKLANLAAGGNGLSNVNASSTTNLSANKSAGGYSANASGLAQVLNTFPQFKSIGNGGATSSKSHNTTTTTTAANSSSSSVSCPQSYLHGHAAQWSGPTHLDQTAMASKPPPPPTPDPKNKERYRKVRDPDTNQEIIYF